MRALIAYASRDGTTELCANEIKKEIACPVDIVDVKKNSGVNIDAYDAVITGGPVYGGKILPPVSRFAESRTADLRKRILGLYICCLYDGERADAELVSSFSPSLHAHAAARASLGGRLAVSKLGR
jgi:menaquinone-dependent protoporphyrinogen oxidase